MKYTLLAILTLSLNISTYCQVECNIYEKIIDAYTLKHKQPNDNRTSVTLIILETPYYMKKPEIGNFFVYKTQYKKLEENTFIDFVNKNQEDLQMGNIKYSNVEIVIINHEQSKNWEELFTTYPNWNFSILEFSNIGFNEEKSQAFVYYGFNSGALAAGGIYIIFEKKRGKWKEKAVIPAWTS